VFTVLDAVGVGKQLRQLGPHEMRLALRLLTIISVTLPLVRMYVHLERLLMLSNILAGDTDELDKLRLKLAQVRNPSGSIRRVPHP
jgi:hypothetical protein